MSTPIFMYFTYLLYLLMSTPISMYSTLVVLPTYEYPNLYVLYIFVVPTYEYPNLYGTLVVGSFRCGSNGAAMGNPSCTAILTGWSPSPDSCSTRTRKRLSRRMFRLFRKSIFLNEIRQRTLTVVSLVASSVTSFGRFIGILSTFQSLWQQLVCQNLSHS